MDNIIVKYQADVSEMQQDLEQIAKENDKIGDTAQEAGKKTTRAMKDADKQAEKSKDTFKRLGAAILAAFAVQRVISFTKEMANLGVQLETTAQRMRVVFGGAARDVEKQADSMAESLGLSVNQFKLMASQVGDVLVPLGLARDQAAKMSSEAVKLAGALSEFSAGQVDTNQAVHALIGAFTGEREALKTLGVVINEADLQARLAQKGQKNLQGQALSTAKAFATFELILERSSDAQTFFTENAGSAARQQAELQAQTQTLREEFAKRLSPAITSATKSLIGLVKNIDPDQVIRFAKAVVAVGTGFITYKVVKSIGDFAVALRALTAPTGIGLAIGLVGTLGSALGLFSNEVFGASKQVDTLTESEKALKDITANSNKQIDQETASVKALFEQLKKSNPESQQRLDLIKQINDQYNTTLTNLKDEEKFALQVSGAYEKVISQLKQKIILEANTEKITELLKEQIKLEDQLKSITGEGEDNVFKRIEAQEKLNSLNERTRKEEEKIADRVRGKLRIVTRDIDKLLEQNAQLEFGTPEPEVVDPNKKPDKRVKEEEITQDDILKVQRKANEKMFKASIDAITDHYKVRRTLILNNEEIGEQERIDKLTKLDEEYLQDKIDVYNAFAMSSIELELQQAETIDEIRQANFEREKARKTQEAEDAKKLTDFKIQLERDTRKALINTANIILDLSQQLGDDALGLAVFQILLNRAVAISEAIKGALSAASDAGVAAPVVAPLLIAQLTGLVVGGFAEVQGVITQAQQQRQSSRRKFARGGIMIEGDGSSTGDSIPAMISPRESIINANSTRKHYEELLAINSGTFDKLVNAKYIIPALKKAAQPQVIVDAGFNDSRLYSQMEKASKEEKRRHKEVIKALNRSSVRRKQMS